MSEQRGATQAWTKGTAFAAFHRQARTSPGPLQQLQLQQALRRGAAAAVGQAQEQPKQSIRQGLTALLRRPLMQAGGSATAHQGLIGAAIQHVGSCPAPQCQPPQAPQAPTRCFGVPIASLSAEHATAAGVPVIVERTLQYLFSALVLCPSQPPAASACTHSLVCFRPRVRDWSPAQFADWAAEALADISPAAYAQRDRVRAWIESAGVCGKAIKRIGGQDLAGVIDSEADCDAFAERSRELFMRSCAADAAIKGRKLYDRELAAVNAAMSLWDSGSGVDYAAVRTPPGVACCAMKQYLRALPEPLPGRDATSKLAALGSRIIAARGGGLKLADFGPELESIVGSLGKAQSASFCAILKFLRSATGREEGVRPCSVLNLALAARVFAFCALHSTDQDMPALSTALAALVVRYKSTPVLLDRDVVVGPPLLATTSGESLAGEQVIATFDSARVVSPSSACSRHGKLLVTNYRVVWSPPEVGTGGWWCEIALGAISHLREMTVPSGQGVKVVSRGAPGMLSLWLPSAAEASRFVDVLTRAANSTPFAWSNRELSYSNSQEAQAATAGWNFWKPEAELARLSLTKEYNLVFPPQRFSSFNGPYFPRECFVPKALDPFLFSYAERRQQVPVVSWVHPVNKKVLYRSVLLPTGRRQGAVPLEEERTADKSLELFLRLADVQCVCVGDQQQSQQPTSLCGVETFAKLFSEFHRLCLSSEAEPTWKVQWIYAQKQWLQQIDTLLMCAVTLSRMVDTGASVLIRACEEEEIVPVVTSLVSIILDPFHRTIDGFAALIEKEWLSHGFPYSRAAAKTDDGALEELPANIAFLVFCDCVWQLWNCFPTRFQFSEALLSFLVDQLWTARFGTFLLNLTESESDRKRLMTEAPSVWPYIHVHEDQFDNPLYSASPKVPSLLPRIAEMAAPRFWGNFFARWRCSCDQFQQCVSAFESDKSGALVVSDLAITFFPAAPISSNSFKNIIFLDLSGNSLSCVPSAVFTYCSNLRSLNISRNNIEWVAKETVSLAAARLPSLQELDVSQCLLSALPPNISELKSLLRLAIAANELRAPPKEVFSMTNIRSISLSGCLQCRKVIPDGIKNLVNLEELDVSHNKLGALNETALAALAKLRMLNVSHNRLRSLHELPRLGQLEVLDASFNSLEVLVFRLSELTALAMLDVSQNRLAALTPAVGQLTRLRSLVADGNPLASIPPTLCACTKLTELRIPEGLFPEGCTTPAQRIVHMRAAMASRERVYRSKLFLVGKENVGKTVFLNCLVKRYKKHSSNLQSISTDGVDITTWEYDDANQHRISVDIWDFAGQMIHMNTHQIFLTGRAVFSLIWKIPLGEQACRVHYWLNTISTSTRSATVFVIGTHIDLDEAGSSSKVDKLLAEMAARYTKLFPTLRLLFRAVSNATKEGLKRLRAEIRQEISAQSHVGESIPMTYLLLEKEAVQLRAVMNPPVLRRSDWQTVATCCGIDTEAELEHATQVLHDMGSVLCFRQKDPRLSELVFLDPRWLPKILATLYTHKHRWVKDGIIKVSDLHHVWKAPNVPEELHGSLLELFEVFNLLFWLPSDVVAQHMDLSNIPSTARVLGPSTSPAPQCDSPAFVVVPAAIRAAAKGPVSPGLLPGGLRPPQVTRSVSPLEDPSADPVSYLSDGASPDAVAREQQQAADELEAEMRPFSDSRPTLAIDASWIIFVPAMLPDEIPTAAVERLWPVCGCDEAELGRQYVFAGGVPDALFSRMTVVFGHSYTLRALWRTGVIFDCPEPVVARVLARVAGANLDSLIVCMRYSTAKAGGHSVVEAGRLTSHLLGVIGDVIKKWFTVQVSSSIICSSCLEHSRGVEAIGAAGCGTIPLPVVLHAVVAGQPTLTCPVERQQLPLASLAPDLVVLGFARAHRELLLSWQDLEIKDVVGEGTAATVHKAVYRGETVAVKLFRLEKEGLASLSGEPPAADLSNKVLECRREIMVLSRHAGLKNIPKLVGLVLQPLALVSEFLGGGTLFDKLHKSGAEIAWPVRLQWAADIAQVMASFHAAGILHRDLKSPNILLRLPARRGDPEGAVVSDFGLSGEPSSDPVPVDNPMWLAPEVLQRKPFTEKADIMYELASRKQFFGEFSFMSNIADAVIAGKRPPVPASAPSNYATLLNRCWAQDPQSRPAFGEIATELTSELMVLGSKC
eukprot:m51a1_g12223 putative leucine-rich repeat-containing protein (2167) ;mRNA; f:41731-50444